MSTNVRNGGSYTFVLPVPKLGIGSDTVPHGAVGHAKLAIEGTDQSYTDGPNIQITTSADDYPLIEVLPYVHDNITIRFDAYHDGTNNISSDAGSNFMIRKQNDVFDIAYAAGVAAGSALTWASAIAISSSGNTGLKTTPGTATLTVLNSAVLSAATTENAYFDIGAGRSGNGYAFLDLIGDATYTDYGFRIIRNNTGANASTALYHRGTEGLFICTVDAANLDFYTSNTFRMRVKSNGYVGIGGIDPALQFDVQANTSGNWAAMIFNDGDNADRYGLRLQCGADNQTSGTHFYLGAHDGDGTAEGYLRVNAGTFELVQASDARRKTAIQDTQIDSLNIVNSISVREFRYKKGESIGTLHKAGFIAQELEQVFPDMVSVGPDGTKMIAPTQLIPILVKAIQQLSAEVEELRKRVK